MPPKRAIIRLLPDTVDFSKHRHHQMEKSQLRKKGSSGRVTFGKEATETPDRVLKEEVRRANRLCKKEEMECGDAESLSDPDYVYESESEDGSYESDFIDDTEADEREIALAMNHIRRKGSAPTSIGITPYRGRGDSPTTPL